MLYLLTVFYFLHVRLYEIHCNVVSTCKLSNKSINKRRRWHYANRYANRSGIKLISAPSHHQFSFLIMNFKNFQISFKRVMIQYIYFQGYNFFIKLTIHITKYAILVSNAKISFSGFNSFLVCKSSLI